MAGGATSALGTITRVSHSGDQATPVPYDLITMPGDADYATGGTTGLLAALRLKTKDNREIVAAENSGQLVHSSGAAVTTWYHVTYDRAHDKIQVWKSSTGNPDAEVAAGTDLSAIRFEWIVWSR